MGNERSVDILLVDDNEGHTELVRRNLRRSGIRNTIVPLTDGQSALDYVFCCGKYEGRPVKNELLLLLDINMPGGVNGDDVLRQIKADPEKRKIPVIMLTTTDDPREVERCYALGCNIYIMKPVDPAAFIDAIHKLGMFVSIVSVPPENGMKP